MSNFLQNTSPPRGCFRKTFCKIPHQLVVACGIYFDFARLLKEFEIKSATNEVCLAPFPLVLNFLQPCMQAYVSL